MARNSVIGLVVLALIAGIATLTVRAVEGDTEVRITVRRLDDGRTEFGLQQRHGGGDWGERQLPQARYLPAEIDHDRWLNSSPLTVGAPAPAPVAARPQPGPNPPAGWKPARETIGTGEADLWYEVERDPLSDTLTTIVRTHANDFSIELVCAQGKFDVLVDWDYRFFYGDGEVILLRFDGGEIETVNWRSYRGATSGYSPDDDATFVERLKRSQTLTVQFGGGSSGGATIDLAGLFTTPAQPNIDYCGRSTPGGVALLGETNGLVFIDIEYWVSPHLDPTALTTGVTLRRGSGTLHMICDVDRLDIILNDSALWLWITEIESTPVTSVRLDGRAATTHRWMFVFSVESGISPDDDAAFIAQLRQARVLEFHINPGSGSQHIQLPLAGLFETPVQANLDYCGQY